MMMKRNMKVEIQSLIENHKMKGLELIHKTKVQELIHMKKMQELIHMKKGLELIHMKVIYHKMGLVYKMEEK